MYAMSYEKDFFVLNEFKNRKEAEDSFQFNTLNLIYEICFNKQPKNLVLKNKDIQIWIEEHKDVSAFLIEHKIDVEKVKDNAISKLVVLPKLMKDFIKIKDHFSLSHNEHAYNKHKILELAKNGFANTI